jgi:cysteine desulfurase/selenocysteine lyase
MQLIQRQDSAKAIEPKSEAFQCPEVLGANHSVPSAGRSPRIPQIFLDNGASTKPFRAGQRFSARDCSRTTPTFIAAPGLTPILCTERYEEARRIVGEFVGWDCERDVVIPVRNTTEGMNLLANTISFAPGDRVLTTILEHHSSDLPWRSKAQVEHLPM